MFIAKLNLAKNTSHINNFHNAPNHEFPKIVRTDGIEATVLVYICYSVRERTLIKIESVISIVNPFYKNVIWPVVISFGRKNNCDERF